MVLLNIRHKTTYRYRMPVALNPHRLMLRPRESRDLRLHAMDLAIEPAAHIAWMQDIVGNSVATASFPAMTTDLAIESLVQVQLNSVAWPVFDIAASAISYPFAYGRDEQTDLGALAVPQHEDPRGELRDWAAGFVYATPTDTLALLKDVNAGVATWISYLSRDDEGTQPPLQTLGRRCGSCRDLAVLFAEAVRVLGFGARIVSGYLYDPDRRAVGSGGDGTTHAWADVYLPGAGWIAFDPTNRSVGGANLIPTAVGRDIGLVVPVAGSFAGESRDFDGMTVEVAVTDR